MVFLVTGASGFLGSRLVHRLVANGDSVVAVARRPAPPAMEAQPRVRWLTCDIARDGLPVHDLPELDAVVHLAGATLGAGKDENLFLQANEQTTVRLMQALAGRATHFVLASSQVVYGDPRRLDIAEDAPLHPDGSAYACSKVNSENWMRWFHARHGGRCLALRFCGFVDGGGIVDYLIDQALAGEPIELHAQGKICRDYLASEDGVAALVAAMHCRGAAEFVPVNIGSGQAVSASELAAIVIKELGAASAVTLSDRPSPLGDFGFCIDRARQLLNFQPGDLRDAVRRHARHRQDQAQRQTIQ